MLNVYSYYNNRLIFEALKELLSTIEGITRATARVVGRTYFANRVVAVVGLDRPSLLALMPLVRGNPPERPGDVLIGHHTVYGFPKNPVVLGFTSLHVLRNVAGMTVELLLFPLSQRLVYECLNHLPSFVSRRIGLSALSAS